MLYKIITKLIAERLKPFLGNFILEEQFYFLPDKQIIDVVGIAQDFLHSVKSQKKNVFCLKLDMYKAYHSLDLSYLRLTLIKIELSYDIVVWIMCFITSVSFVVLINGVLL